MNGKILPVDSFGGDCHRDGCDEPIPWDMPAIVINRTNVYCSPSCAMVEVHDLGKYETVTLHDPQYRTDNPDGVPSDAVDIGRETPYLSDAVDAIIECVDRFPLPFRNID